MKKVANHVHFGRILFMLIYLVILSVLFITGFARQFSFVAQDYFFSSFLVKILFFDRFIAEYVFTTAVILLLVNGIFFPAVSLTCSLPFFY